MIEVMFTHKNVDYDAISAMDGSCVLCLRMMFKQALRRHLCAQNYGIRMLIWIRTNGINASTYGANACK